MRNAPERITQELFNDLNPLNRYLAIETLVDVTYIEEHPIPKGSKGVVIGSVKNEYLTYFPKSVAPNDKTWTNAVVRVIQKTDAKIIGRVGH